MPRAAGLFSCSPQSWRSQICPELACRSKFDGVLKLQRVLQRISCCCRQSRKTCFTLAVFGRRILHDNVKQLTDYARSWDRRSIRGEPGCPPETCAFFVRHVFRTVLHKSGVMPVAHFRPYYQEHHVQSLPTNENFADGLAGDIIGMRVPTTQVRSSDILFFKDTYFSQDFPVGSITHVGIALDSSGTMADSSGGRCHVRNHTSTFPGKLVEVRRPRCFGSVSTGTGLTLSQGRVSKNGNFKEVKIVYAGGTPKVYLDGQSRSFRYITVNIAESSLHFKLFSHDGHTKALVAGHHVRSLEVVAQLQNGLHVSVGGRELKPSSVHIGVS